MENTKVKELIEICEELGLILGRAQRKQAILEIMRDAGGMTEEVDEAWADIKARREKAERQKSCEKAKRQERLELKRIELAILKFSQAPSIAFVTVHVSGYRNRDQLPPFV